MRQASAQTPKDQETPKKDEEVEKVEVQQDDEIDLEIEGDEPEAVEAKPAAKVEPKEDEALALRKQVEELRRSEEAATKRAVAAQKARDAEFLARTKAEAEVSRSRIESEQSQMETLNAAISAAKAEADAAQQQIEIAMGEGDAKKQAEAYRALARAEANIGRLADGKDELEYRINVMRAEAKKVVEAKTAEPEKTEERPVEKIDPIESLQVPDRAKEWLREHREYAEDARKNAKLQVAHWEALDEGHKEFSTPYFAAIERLLGLGKQEEVEEEVSDDNEEVEVSEPVRKQSKPEQRRSSIVSAPVSRDSTSSGDAPSKTKVRLSKEQAEFAQMAGISPAEYAKQLLKLQELKRKGEIQ